MPRSKKKFYVLDTSVYLTNADSIFGFKYSDIIIPIKVLEEIDKHKKRQDAVGANARRIIRILDDLREKGSLKKGVRLAPNQGIVKVVSSECTRYSGLPTDLDLDIPDHIIIATALCIKQEHKYKKVVLVSRDINMRVIAESVGLTAQDFHNHQVVDNSEEIFTGVKEVVVDEGLIDNFYNKEPVYLDNTQGIYPNQYLILTSAGVPKKSALAKFINDSTPLRHLYTPSKKGTWGVKARNKEQSFLIDMLMDQNIKVATVIGKAGSGKTLCALAAGLEQTLENNFNKGAEKDYTRMIVSRPVQPLGKDIGFLPGTMEEKMAPWLMPIQDNLQYLMGNNKSNLEMYMAQGIIELEAITYIRGRSISNAYIIIDEAQNLTIHELKTIITRVGEGTKIILTGDVEQIDSVYIDARSNGLTHAIEKFKKFHLAGHITLQKGERSELATYAAKNL